MLNKTAQRVLLTTTVFGLMSFTASSAKATQFSSALLVDSIEYPAGVGAPAIKAYDPTTGAFLGDFVSPGNGLNEPDGAVFGKDGNLYVTDLSGDRPGGQVLEYNGTTGQFIKNFIPYLTADPNNSLVKVSHPDGITIDPNGNFYIANNAQYLGGNPGPSGNFDPNVSDSIMEFSPTGAFMRSFALAPSTSPIGPVGLAIDPNNPNNLYVAAINNGSVLKVNLTQGAFNPVTTFIAPNSNGLSGPTGLLINNGILYVNDYGSPLGSSFTKANKIFAYSLTTGALLGQVASGVLGDSTKGSPVDGPTASVISPTGQFIEVSDNNSAIAILDPTIGNTSASAFKGYLVQPGAGGLNFPVLTALYANNITIGANAASVPEPSANLSLLGLSALGVGALIKRGLKKQQS